MGGGDAGGWGGGQGGDGDKGGRVVVVLELQFPLLIIYKIQIFAHIKFNLYFGL